MKIPLAYKAPGALLDEADAEMNGVPKERLFNDSRCQKMKEKWCAAMLGVGYEKCVAPCFVAVNDTQHRSDADLFLKIGQREYPFQLVMASEPERRLGAEYKGFANGTLRGIPYTPQRGHEEGPCWIADKIRKKAEKNYADANSLNLLVYANFSAGNLQYADVVAAARPYLSTFASVWVFSSLQLSSLHVANDLGRIDGWGTIFTPEEAMARHEDKRKRET